MPFFNYLSYCLRQEDYRQQRDVCELLGIFSQTLPAKQCGAMVVRRCARQCWREEPKVKDCETKLMELQVLCALRLYATGLLPKLGGQRRARSVRMRTVGAFVRVASVAILRRLGVRRGWGYFPETPSERCDVERSLKLLGRIPGVIGRVNGTMIAMVGPSNSDITVTKGCTVPQAYLRSQRGDGK